MRRIAIVIALLAAGCRTETARGLAGGAERPAPGAAEAETGAPPASGPAPAGTAPAPSEPGPAAPSPPSAPPSPPAAAGTMTLAEAIRAALARNPDLAVIEKGEAVSGAALEVARAYPYNPEVAVDVRPYTREHGGDRGETFVEAALLQEIELGRQGKYRERKGAAELERARWSIRGAEVAVIAETERRFFTAIYWRERLELDEALAKLKQELSGITERRFEAGLSASSAVSLARIEAQTRRQGLELTRMRREAALLDLRQHLGMAPAAPLEPAGRLDAWRWTAVSAQPGAGGGAGSGLAGRVDTAAAGRADVRSAEASAGAAAARLDLAAAERVPSIRLGPVYEKDEAGTSFLGLKVELPLPILNTGGPLERQRRAEAEQSIEEARQLHVKAAAEVEAALARYERALRLAAQFRDGLMEGIELDSRRVSGQYEAGQADIVDVYAARTNEIQARLNRLEALFDLSLAAANLTAAAELPAEALLEQAPAEKAAP